MSEFFYIVSELKKTQRKGWKEKVGIQNPESVADHSYGVAMMAMVFADIGNLNTEKVLAMALLHDLAESITGDFTPDEISKENKRTIEDQTMTDILSKLPSNLEDKYGSLWKEYLMGESKESILLHEVDKLEMAMQLPNILGRGFLEKNFKNSSSRQGKESNQKNSWQS